MNSSANEFNGTVTIHGLCEGTVSACVDGGWMTSLVYTMNILVIIANILHISVLIVGKGAQEGVYLTMVVLLSVWEILTAFRVILQSNCSLRWITMRNRAVSWLILLFSDFVNFGRFVILTVAFIDRWMAIAKPFQYQDGLFVRRLWVWITTPCLLTVILIVVRDLLSGDTICMDEAVGITNCVNDSVVRNVCQFYYCVSIVVDTVFMVLLMKELWKMRRRNLNADDRDLQAATRTLLVLAAVYYACLTITPVTSWEIEDLIPESQQTQKTLAKLGYYIPLALYGLFNVVVYGLMSKGYRSKLKKLAYRCVGKQARVYPR